MTKSSDVGERQAKSTRAKVVVIGGLVPVAIGVIATVLMLTWLPDLPDPIAVHWGGAGADGFGPALPFALLPALTALIVGGGAVSMAWRPSASGRLGWNQKIVVVMSVWLSTLISGGFGAGVAMQRGLADARESPGVGTSLALAAAIGILLAAAAWFILPRGESVDEPGAAARPVDVRGEERVSWSKSARIGTTPMLLIGLVIVVALATVVASVLASPTWTLHGTVTIAVVAALAVTSFWWRVSADRRGFIAKGLLGWPRKRISLDRIRSVRVVEVHPTRDFGGWGWRWAGDGRSGIVLFSGQGIEVTQLNGKRFVVTVEDAKTGAGVLAALLARRSRS
ncbi:MAG TPA: DUF1648 domain-containing protein [Terrimesophilobacter sp.]|uniref:DUF1648 domain-containing protein n=1 Tax=Terrimesophilobacter sp. TaxID=2906435 RepID=UPI002F943FEF